MQKYKISNIGNDGKPVYEVEGEIMQIEGVFVGIKKNNFFGDDKEFDEYNQYNTTHLETGAKIVSLANSREEAIKKTEEKICSDKWAKAVAKMKKTLKENNIKYPVNDISKFKTDNMTMGDKKTKTVKVKFHINESYKRLKALEYIYDKTRHTTGIRKQEVIEEFDLTQFFFDALYNLKAALTTPLVKGYCKCITQHPFELTREFAKKVYEEEVRLRDGVVEQPQKRKYVKNAEKTIVNDNNKSENQNYLFVNPANIGASLNDLERFLRIYNNAENTQIFIDAVTEAYLEAGKLKERQQMIPEDKNELDKDDFVLDLLKCINSSNINEKDKISIKYYLESLCSLKVKYLKLIGEKSIEKEELDDVNECLKFDFNKLSELENKYNELREEMYTINDRELAHFDVFYKDLENIKKNWFIRHFNKNI